MLQENIVIIGAIWVAYFVLAELFCIFIYYKNRRLEEMQLCYIDRLSYYFARGENAGEALTDTYLSLKIGNPLKSLMRQCGVLTNYQIDYESCYKALGRALDCWGVRLLHDLVMGFEGSPVPKSMDLYLHELKQYIQEENTKKIHLYKRQRAYILASKELLFVINLYAVLKWQTSFGMEVFVAVNTIGLIIYSIFNYRTCSFGRPSLAAGRLEFLEYLVGVGLYAEEATVGGAMVKAYDKATPGLKLALKPAMEGLRTGAGPEIMDYEKNSLPGELETAAVSILVENRKKRQEDASEKVLLALRNYTAGCSGQVIQQDIKRARSLTLSLKRGYQLVAGLGLMLNAVQILQLAVQATVAA